MYENFSLRAGREWHGALCIFDNHHGGILHDIFPQLLRILDTASGADVERGLYWYLQSNFAGQGPGPDGGLILSVAALEILSHAYVADKYIENTNGKKVNIMRKAFEKLGIPTSIREEHPNLKILCQKKKLFDRIDAVTRIRNSLVHAEKEDGIDLSSVTHEAWNLAQWYIELFMLGWLGYEGLYKDRIGSRWRGTVKKVPWG